MKAWSGSQPIDGWGLQWPVLLVVSLLLVSLGGFGVRECRLSMGSLRLQRGCGRMLV
jgi:hypothetical protein